MKNLSEDRKEAIRVKMNNTDDYLVKQPARTGIGLEEAARLLRNSDSSLTDILDQEPQPVSAESLRNIYSSGISISFEVYSSEDEGFEYRAVLRRVARKESESSINGLKIGDIEGTVPEDTVLYRKATRKV